MTQRAARQRVCCAHCRTVMPESIWLVFGGHARAATAELPGRHTAFTTVRRAASQLMCEWAVGIFWEWLRAALDAGAAPGSPGRCHGRAGAGTEAPQPARELMKLYAKPRRAPAAECCSGHTRSNGYRAPCMCPSMPPLHARHTARCKATQGTVVLCKYGVYCHTPAVSESELAVRSTAWGWGMLLRAAYGGIAGARCADARHEARRPGAAAAL